MSRGLLLSSLAVTTLTALVSCGPPPTASVSGTVAFQKTPITLGLITFQSEVAGAANSIVNGEIREGKYSVKGVTIGPVKIGVTSSPPPKLSAPPPGVKEVGASTPPPKGPFVAVPTKFGQPTTSGLSYVVKSGDQQYDLDLQP